MKIHKEGYRIIFNSFIIITAVVTLFFLFSTGNSKYWVLAIALLLFVFVVSFFRVPKRQPTIEEGSVIAPADGKIVVVKKVYEPEYLKEEVLQVSIFMSVFNVHANWYPIKGKVLYFKYHPGKYLVATHPKSSEKNERTTVVIENGSFKVLSRQIAGYVARRIVCYVKEGFMVGVGEQMGFIKFGSRVDLFLPLDSRVQVTKNQKVKGLQTVIAKLPGTLPQSISDTPQPKELPELLVKENSSS